MTDIGEAHMAHFLYLNGESCVSVFVVPVSDFTIPEDIKAHALQVGDITVYDHNCRGCRLTYRQVGNLIIISASECKKVDLPKFVPGELAA